MSIFIGGLAFSDPELVDEAKIAILAASAFIGAIGFGVLSRVATGAPPQQEEG